MKKLILLTLLTVLTQHSTAIDIDGRIYSYKDYDNDNNKITITKTGGTKFVFQLQPCDKSKFTSKDYEWCTSLTALDCLKFYEHESTGFKNALIYIMQKHGYANKNAIVIALCYWAFDCKSLPFLNESYDSARKNAFTLCKNLRDKGFTILRTFDEYIGENWKDCGMKRNTQYSNMQCNYSLIIIDGKNIKSIDVENAD